MSNEFDDTQSKIAALMSEPRYVQMLLGLAVARLPDGLEVSPDDYASLIGYGLMMSAGSRPSSFRLTVKKTPTDDHVGAIPDVGIVGQA